VTEQVTVIVLGLLVVGAIAKALFFGPTGWTPALVSTTYAQASEGWGQLLPSTKADTVQPWTIPLFLVAGIALLIFAAQTQLSGDADQLPVLLVLISVIPFGSAFAGARTLRARTALELDIRPAFVESGMPVNCRIVLKGAGRPSVLHVELVQREFAETYSFWTKSSSIDVRYSHAEIITGIFDDSYTDAAIWIGTFTIPQEAGPAYRFAGYSRDWGLRVRMRGKGRPGVFEYYVLPIGR